MALWGGRFESGPDVLFKALNESLRFDFRLARQDIAGSVAWARAIGRAGVLKGDEVAKLEGALKELDALVCENPHAPLGGHGTEIRGTHEDIHSWVESKLIEKVGDLGKKLHTGRSRNDQVATDVRLWTREAIDARVGELKESRRALISLAEREKETVFPGYTHLQRAQPILFAHWALAYEEMLERDAARLVQCRGRVNVMPLGSGALAGTTYAVDRELLAKDLGFDAPSRNSLDATADRDFIAETLFCLAQTSVHLSRMAEDLILFMTQEYGFVEMTDAVTSGSSLMPQKKNPDACELLRGKAGRVIGSLVSMLTTMKGLPLAYNKDLQEDKEPLFDGMEQLSMCLLVVPKILDGLKVRREVCRVAAKGGYSNATELADYLVGKGMPFREAHDVVGKIVRFAIEKKAALEELTLADLQKFAPVIGQDVFECLTLESCLARREIFGGTGPVVVSAAIASARKRMD